MLPALYGLLGLLVGRSQKPFLILIELYPEPVVRPQLTRVLEDFQTYS